MEKINIKSIYYSPSGTTAKVAKALTAGITNDFEYIDLMKKQITTPLQLEEVIIVAMPVFAGRIPNTCIESLNNLKGEGKAAIAVVVYGNRDYDDALLELCDILKNSGFCVLAAGAFVAQHSIFNQVANGRPNNQDLEDIKSFAQLCSDKLSKFNQSTTEEKTNMSVTPKGNLPYLTPNDIPLKPKTDSSCNSCKKCIEVCLVGAIPRDNPKETDDKKCVSCTACIFICPQNARHFGKIAHKAAGAVFSKKYSQAKNNEWFI